MSLFDAQITQSLRDLAAGIDFDPEDLVVVRERAHEAGRRTRRRTAWCVLAASVLAAAAVITLARQAGQTSDEPVGPVPTSPAPTGTGARELADPFTVVRTVEASRIGLGKVLRVAVSQAGRVYVTDAGQHVTELSADGAVITRWGGAGTAPGRFRLYSGAVAVGPDGKVYVADTGNFRIEVFSSGGRFLAQYGGYGRGPGRFVWPSDIVVAPDGTMYVADDRAATVTALTPSGQQLWRHGTPDETDPRWIGHEHLGGVTPQGQLVTANDDAGQVLFVDPDGRVADSFSTNRAGAGVDARGIPGGHFPNGTCGATFDAQGDVYVSSCEESYQRQHDTAVYDPRHRLVAGWKRGILVDPPVFGPDGRGWAVTSGNRALVELAVHLPES
jgi:hypothetical protein